jgi:hypothetical protein
MAEREAEMAEAARAAVDELGALAKAASAAVASQWEPSGGSRWEQAPLPSSSSHLMPPAAGTGTVAAAMGNTLEHGPQYELYAAGGGGTALLRGEIHPGAALASAAASDLATAVNRGGGGGGGGGRGYVAEGGDAALASHLGARSAAVLQGLRQQERQLAEIAEAPDPPPAAAPAPAPSSKAKAAAAAAAAVPSPSSPPTLDPASASALRRAKQLERDAGRVMAAAMQEVGACHRDLDAARRAVVAERLARQSAEQRLQQVHSRSGAGRHQAEAASLEATEMRRALMGEQKARRAAESRVKVLARRVEAAGGTASTPRAAWGGGGGGRATGSSSAAAAGGGAGRPASATSATAPERRGASSDARTGGGYAQQQAKGRRPRKRRPGRGEQNGRPAPTDKNAQSS